jgi:LPXTG-site transpeptidase (sortase) family protein
MAEQTRRKPFLSALSRFEQFALIGTALIWVGVLLAGVGLFYAFRHRAADRTPPVQATAVVLVPTETATASPTPVVYPVGWSTATPTLTPTRSEQDSDEPGAGPTPTRVVATPVLLDARQTPRSAAATPTPTATLSALYPPDRVVAPAINLDSTVVPIGWHVVTENGQRYSVWEVADNVVGWHKTSSYPGQKGNLVLNGHHNIKGEVFRYLVDLEIGDSITVYARGKAYTYAVIEKHILKEKGESAEVRLENARWIAPSSDERLTMVTCWPYTSNTHRLVVVAMPISPPDLSVLKE